MEETARLLLHDSTRLWAPGRRRRNMVMQKKRLEPLYVLSQMGKCHQQQHTFCHKVAGQTVIGSQKNHVTHFNVRLWLNQRVFLKKRATSLKVTSSSAAVFIPWPKNETNSNISVGFTSQKTTQLYRLRITQKKLYLPAAKILAPASAAILSAILSMCPTKTFGRSRPGLCLLVASSY